MMTEQEVVDLMKSSKSEAEWDINCAKVQESCGGYYPPFWFSAIILSGVSTTTAAGYGKPGVIEIFTVKR